MSSASDHFKRLHEELEQYEENGKSLSPNEKMLLYNMIIVRSFLKESGINGEQFMGMSIEDMVGEIQK